MWSQESKRKEKADHIQSITEEQRWKFRSQLPSDLPLQSSEARHVCELWEPNCPWSSWWSHSLLTAYKSKPTSGLHRFKARLLYNICGLSRMICLYSNCQTLKKHTSEKQSFLHYYSSIRLWMCLVLSALHVDLGQRLFCVSLHWCYLLRKKW